MEGLSKKYLSDVGISAEAMQRAMDLPALRDECRACHDYMFTIDAWIIDAEAVKIQETVNQVLDSSGYDVVHERYSLFCDLVNKESSGRDEKILPLQSQIDQNKVRVREINCICIGEIEGLYDTCLKKILRVIVAIFARICCTKSIVYRAKEVDAIDEKYRIQTEALQGANRKLKSQIANARKPFDSNIQRFKESRDWAAWSLSNDFQLSKGQKKLVKYSGQTQFEWTKSQLAFVAQPVDEFKESEEGGNTREAREGFLMKVETLCRKYMHRTPSFSIETNYRLAFDELVRERDLSLIYGRMSKDELAQRIAEAKEKGAILPPPPRPAPKPYVRSTEEQARWDSECAASHGCWKSVTH